MELFPQVFISIFTNDPDLMAMASWAIRIYMACVLLMGLQISCQQTFIAFGNAKISVFLAIFRKIIVLIPLILSCQTSYPIISLRYLLQNLSQTLLR